MKKFDLLIGVFLAILVSLGFDRFLGILGYPSEFTQVAHPANYVETRRNLEFTVEFRTNSQGIRYREVPLEKPEPGTRFVVVGDSFTEGHGVEEDRRFTNVLERILSTPSNPVEFINCGLSGTGTFEYARVLLHIGMKYNPDAALIVLHPNDVINASPSSKFSQVEIRRSGIRGVFHALWPRLYTILKLLPKTNANSRTIQNQKDVDVVARVVQEARKRGISEAQITTWKNRLPPDLIAAANHREFNAVTLANGLLRPDYWLQSLDIQGQEAETRYHVMISILNGTVDRCRDQNIPVGLVLTPSPFQYDANYGDIWKNVGGLTRPHWAFRPTELELRLAAWVKKKDVPYLDLTPYYRSVIKEVPDPPLHYPMDGHWTPRGHEVAANRIAEWLSTWILR